MAPEPTAGALIGYARASVADQRLDMQLRTLEERGCSRIFSDDLPGKNAARPQLAACIDYLRPGDTLVVVRLDRLSRSLQDLIATVADLGRHGVGFRSVHESLDTTTPGGRLIFHVFAGLAEFIRELIVEGTHEGVEAARARGVRLGRPPAMTPEQVLHARSLLSAPENSVSSIARLLGVSRSTIYKYIPEITSGTLAYGQSQPLVSKPRPGRRSVVATRLTDLRGPSRGKVELPLRLFWSSPDRTFDLSRPAMARSMYEAVLREAASSEDLAQYLDGGTLRRMWPELFLPRGLKQAWEDRHPQLRATQREPRNATG